MEVIVHFKNKWLFDSLRVSFYDSSFIQFHTTIPNNINAAVAAVIIMDILVIIPLIQALQPEKYHL